MRPIGRIFVYIDTKRNYYARYSGVVRTHAFEYDEPVAPYWVEMLRTAPETWDPPEKEAA